MCYTVLPSLFSSSKLASTNDVIGTFLQDRATAIAGRLGPGPSMLPVTLTIDNARGDSRTFKFNVIRDQLFTPLMTLHRSSARSGHASGRTAPPHIRCPARLPSADADGVTFQNLFTGDQALSNAAASVAAPVTALVNNDFEDADIRSVEVTLKSTDEPKIATVERVWIDDPRPRPGRSVPVKVLLRTYRGEEQMRTIPIEIPANATGNLAIMVSDGARLTQTEQREARLPQPRTVPQLVQALNKVRARTTIST